MNKIQNFTDFNEGVLNRSKDPIIEYKKVDDKFYKRNPSGGKWVEITKGEYESHKRTDKSGKFTE